MPHPPQDLQFRDHALQTFLDHVASKTPTPGGGSVAAVRHRSMSQVPREIFVLVASDFLMLCYQPLRAAGFLERVTKATTKPG